MQGVTEMFLVLSLKGVVVALLSLISCLFRQSHTSACIC